jgi:hypothetical protein
MDAQSVYPFGLDVEANNVTTVFGAATITIPIPPWIKMFFNINIMGIRVPVIYLGAINRGKKTILGMVVGVGP